MRALGPPGFTRATPSSLPDSRCESGNPVRPRGTTVDGVTIRMPCDRPDGAEEQDHPSTEGNELWRTPLVPRALLGPGFDLRASHRCLINLSSICASAPVDHPAPILLSSLAPDEPFGPQAFDALQNGTLGNSEALSHRFCG